MHVEPLGHEAQNFKPGVPPKKAFDNLSNITVYNKKGEAIVLELSIEPPSRLERWGLKKKTIVPYFIDKQYYVKIEDVTKIFNLSQEDVTKLKENPQRIIEDTNDRNKLIYNLIKHKLISPDKLNDKDIDQAIQVFKRHNFNKNFSPYIGNIQQHLLENTMVSIGKQLAQRHNQENEVEVKAIKGRALGYKISKENKITFEDEHEEQLLIQLERQGYFTKEEFVQNENQIRSLVKKLGNGELYLEENNFKFNASSLDNINLTYPENKKKILFRTLLNCEKLIDIKPHELLLAVAPTPDTKAGAFIVKEGDKYKFHFYHESTYNLLAFLQQKGVLTHENFPKTPHDLKIFIELANSQIFTDQTFNLSLHKDKDKREKIISTLWSIGRQLANPRGEIVLSDEPDTMSYILTPFKGIIILDQETKQLVKILKKKGASDSEILGDLSGIRSFKGLKGRVKKLDPNAMEKMSLGNPLKRQKIFATFKLMEAAFQKHNIGQTLVVDNPNTYSFIIQSDQNIVIKGKKLGSGGFKRVYDALNLTGSPGNYVWASIKNDELNESNESSNVGITQAEVEKLRRLRKILGNKKNYLVPSYVLSVISGDGIVKKKKLTLLQQKLLQFEKLQSNVWGGKKDLIGVSKLLSQIATGIADMHIHGWVHSDIKPENFLIGEENGDAVGLVSDLGLANEVFKTIEGGTLDFLPPEVFKQEKLPDNNVRVTINHDYPLEISIDSFSFGVAIFEIVTGKSRDKENMIFAFSKETPEEIIEKAKKEIGEKVKVAKKNEKDPGKIKEYESDEKAAYAMLDICKKLMRIDRPEKRMFCRAAAQALESLYKRG